MCPVLSLANRAFLAFLAAILTCTSLPTRAEELQFNITGTAFDNAGSGTLGPVNISFLLDTQSGVSTYTFLPEAGDSGLILDQFNVQGASFSNVNVLVNGQSLMSGNFTGSYAGTNYLSSTPGAFFAGLGFAGNGDTLFWEFDPTPGPTPASLTASKDPMRPYLMRLRTTV